MNIAKQKIKSPLMCKNSDCELKSCFSFLLVCFLKIVKNFFQPSRTIDSIRLNRMANKPVTIITLTFKSLSATNSLLIALNTKNKVKAHISKQLKMLARNSILEKPKWKFSVGFFCAIIEDKYWIK